MAKVGASARWRTAQATVAELELRKRRGEFVDVRAFHLEAGERLTAHKTAVLEIPRQIPPRLVGRSAPEILHLLRKAFSDACRVLEQPLACLEPQSRG